MSDSHETSSITSSSRKRPVPEDVLDEDEVLEKTEQQALVLSIVRAFLYPIETRYHQSYHHESPAFISVTSHVNELIRFLSLVAIKHPPILISDTVSPQTLSPAPKMDEDWHKLLLNPSLYYRVCSFIRDFPRKDYSRSVSAIIPHWPEGEHDSWNVRRVRYEKTLDFYEFVYGEQAPEEEFPSNLYSRNLSINFYVDGALHAETIDVDITDSMDVLQKKLQAITKITGFVYTNGDRFSFDAATLEKSIFEFGFSPLMKNIFVDSRSGISVFFKSLMGWNMQMEVSLGLPVLALKYSIEESQGLATCFQRISFGGKSIPDGCMMSDFSVTIDCEMHLFNTMRGC